MSVTNMFFLKIKLLKLRENGKTSKPVCQMADQILVSLNTFIEDFKLAEGHHPKTYDETIAEFLSKFYAAWNCPIAWRIEMQSYDDFLAFEEEGGVTFENPFYQPESRISQPFLYSPADGLTKIDVGFLWSWALEAVVPGKKAVEKETPEDFNFREALANNVPFFDDPKDEVIN